MRLRADPPILISSTACDMSPLPTSPLRPQLRRGPQHRLDDALVAGAPAEVARQRPAHLSSSVGSGLRASSALAVIAIPGVQNPHCRPCSSLKPSSQQVRFARRGEPLDRLDRPAVRLNQQHRARTSPRRRPQGPCTRRSWWCRIRMCVPVKPTPRRIRCREQQPGLHLGDLLVSVDREDFGSAASAPSPRRRRRGRRRPWSCQAALSAVWSARLRIRSTNVATMCRLYSALPASDRFSAAPPPRRVLPRVRCPMGRSAQTAVLPAPAARPVAAIVAPPTPVSAIPALVTVSPEVSMRAATATVAKSPTLRSSLR